MTMRADASPDCPKWHNPAMLIVWLEKNISPTPRTAALRRCSAYTLDSVDDGKKQTIYKLRFHSSEPKLSDTGRPRANPGLAFGRSMRRLATCRLNPIQPSRGSTKQQGFLDRNKAFSAASQ